MASLSGKTLGNYQIKERLGRGGIAEVYKAYHAKLDHSLLGYNHDRLEV